MKQRASDRGFAGTELLIALCVVAVLVVAAIIYLHARPSQPAANQVPASGSASPASTTTPSVPSPTSTSGGGTTPTNPPQPTSTPITTPPTTVGALPLGTVSDVQALSTCPTGFPASAQCSQATVSCPATANIGVTYGIVPTAGTPKGTIIFQAGSGGTNPFNLNIFKSAFSDAGYTQAVVAWGTGGWQDTGLAAKNVQAAACRPATLFNYIFQSPAGDTGARCLLGFSGGSSAVAYSLAEYGAGSYLDKAMFWSGPPLADMEQGCEVPVPAPITVCPAGQFGCVAGDTFTDTPSFIANGPGVSGWTGAPGCAGNAPTTAQADATWKAMSIVDGLPNSSFDYPHTSLSAYLCDNGVNNSAAEGDIFYQQFTSPSQVASLSITPIKGCQGPEGVTAGQTPSGQNGLSAIIADMTNPVTGCVLHTH
jgi:hypothetical protein